LIVRIYGAIEETQAFDSVARFPFAGTLLELIGCFEEVIFGLGFCLRLNTTQLKRRQRDYTSEF
jgi:hypothetical protein